MTEEHDYIKNKRVNRIKIFLKFSKEENNFE